MTSCAATMGMPDAGAVLPPDGEAEVREFVASSLGAAPERLWRLGASIGFSRIIWFAAHAGKTYVVRYDNGLGPFSLIGSKSLGHEGRLIDRLYRRGLAVPQVFAVSDTGRAILMEALAGEADFSAAGPARAHLIGELARTLGMLHALPANQILPESRAMDALPGDLREYVAAYRAHCEPSPVLEEGLDWLSAHAPAPPERPVIVHGDAGPGNFMFVANRFSGLIDWEMAHVGDPMTDFAAIYFRCYVRGGGGDLADWYAPLLRATRETYDPAKIEYFRLAQFWKAAMTVELFRNNRPDLDAKIFENPMRRVAGALDALRGDPSTLAAMGFPPIPERIGPG